MDSLTHQESINYKDGKCNEDVKSGIAKTQVVFLQLKIFWKNKNINL
jgi:hypothetical protein